MGKFSERIKSRKSNNQKQFFGSLLNLAGMKISDKITREDYIVNELVKYYKVQKPDIPQHIDSLEKKINHLLTVTGLMGRKIELTGSWYLDNRDPLLVYTKDTNTPILLLPRGTRTYYYISYTTGKKIIGTVAMARKLKKEAFAFYRPLPTHKITLKEYFKFFRKSVRAIDFLWVMLFSAAATGVSLLVPYLTKRLTGEVVATQSMHLYIVVSIYLISAGIAFVLIKATQAFMNARVAIKIEKMMQETTMMRMLSLPSSFYKKYTTGELVMRFNSVSLLSSLIFNGVFLTLLSSILSLAFLGQIASFSSSLVLPVVLILLLTTGFNVGISLLQVKVSRTQMRLSAKESGTSYALISSIQKIRLAGAEKRAFARWAKAYAKSSAPLYHPPLIIRIAPVISLAITLLDEITIYYLAARNNVDMSSFVAFSSAFGCISAAATAATEISSSLANCRPVLEMAKPILEEEVEDNESKELVTSLNGDIKLENVNFKYNEDGVDIVKDINIDIKQGEYVGIVGKTGCGKSTLVRLLLGFEKPTSGTIYYDNKDMSTLNLQSLRTKIGSVTQNGGIFHADILSNILITAPNLSEKEAWEAAEIAGIDNDIKSMPMGMHTVISEGQGGISGGQKQRIMIARAIVNKPKVLIFDEATSALDNKTQKSISDSINDLNCTRVVVAHRLSTIEHCDRILYMEDGEIKEAGTYQELINKKGKFFELVQRQRIDV